MIYRVIMAEIIIAYEHLRIESSSNNRMWEILEWEKLGNLVNRMPFANFLPVNYFFLQSVVATHAPHLPICYPPIGLD